jgi:NADH dehydrogenase
MASKSSDLHRIVVVGGGAGGLELVTRLGDKLGRRKLADVTLIDKYRAHLWKPLLHEVAAGSMDLSVHEIDFLAQAHWHHFRYRIGELIGLDRGKREVHLAPHFDEEGSEVTPARSFLTIRWSSPWAARAMTSVLPACANTLSRWIHRCKRSASTRGW